jgi:hypothetical protein
MATPGRVPLDPPAQTQLPSTAQTLRALPRMTTKLKQTHIAAMDVAELEFERDKFDSKW